MLRDAHIVVWPVVHLNIPLCAAVRLQISTEELEVIPIKGVYVAVRLLWSISVSPQLVSRPQDDSHQTQFAQMSTNVLRVCSVGRLWWWLCCAVLWMLHFPRGVPIVNGCTQDAADKSSKRMTDVALTHIQYWCRPSTRLTCSHLSNFSYIWTIWTHSRECLLFTLFSYKVKSLWKLHAFPGLP